MSPVRQAALTINESKKQEKHFCLCQPRQRGAEHNRLRGYLNKNIKNRMNENDACLHLMLWACEFPCMRASRKILALIPSTIAPMAIFSFLQKTEKTSLLLHITRMDNCCSGLRFVSKELFLTKWCFFAWIYCWVVVTLLWSVCGGACKLAYRRPYANITQSPCKGQQ